MTLTLTLNFIFLETHTYIRSSTCMQNFINIDQRKLCEILTFICNYTSNFKVNLLNNFSFHNACFQGRQTGGWVGGCWGGGGGGGWWVATPLKSVRPEVRGTTDFDGGAYPPPKTSPSYALTTLIIFRFGRAGRGR